MLNAIYYVLSLALAMIAYLAGYLVGQRFGYRRGHGDGWCDAVLYKASDEGLRRDVFGGEQ